VCSLAILLVETAQWRGWIATSAGTTPERARLHAVTAMVFALTVATLSALHRRGHSWAIRALTVLLVFVVTPMVRPDAFAAGIPQIVWVVPMLAFALTTLRWALGTTALMLLTMWLTHRGAGAFGIASSWLITAMIVTLLAVQKRRNEVLLASQRAEADARLAAALYDPHTRLPNRRLLADRLEESLKLTARTGRLLAVLFVDLDRFKTVNVALGHEGGDQLLIDAVGRIRAVVRATDTVARYGTDLFALVLTSLGEREIEERGVIERVTHDLLLKLSAPFEIKGHPVTLTASVGIAVSPPDGSTVESLLRAAEHALNNARAQGGNRASYFSADLSEAGERRLIMTRELRQAIARDQLRVHYQPIVDLRTGRVAKAEALLRWEHPELGSVSPAVFVPLAEATGMIHAIGEWVFLQASAQCKAWRERFSERFQISVNRSPAQFGGGRTAMDRVSWTEHLASIALPGDAISMEITEGLLLDGTAGVRDELAAAREAGIRVSLDDFGTGHSALAYLQRYPIDVVKIDRAFVRGLESGSKNLALCRAIISMSHDLGMVVVAEGIETTQERDLLRDAGCDLAQGYLFGRPMPPDAFETWMAARSDERGAS
jgi:diguanylate cyclase (GGDEF)-like protein